MRLGRLGSIDESQCTHGRGKAFFAFFSNPGANLKIYPYMCTYELVRGRQLAGWDEIGLSERMTALISTVPSAGLASEPNHTQAQSAPRRLPDSTKQSRYVPINGKLPSLGLRHPLRPLATQHPLSMDPDGFAYLTCWAKSRCRRPCSRLPIGRASRAAEAWET